MLSSKFGILCTSALKLSLEELDVQLRAHTQAEADEPLAHLVHVPTPTHPVAFPLRRLTMVLHLLAHPMQLHLSENPGATIANITTDQPTVTTTMLTAVTTIADQTTIAVIPGITQWALGHQVLGLWVAQIREICGTRAILVILESVVLLHPQLEAKGHLEPAGMTIGEEIVPT